MLKTLGSPEPLTRHGKSGVGVGGGSRARRYRSELDGKKIDYGEIDGGEIGDDKIGKKVQKLSKFKNLSKSKKTIGLDFLTPRARLAFTKFRQTFDKAPIFHHFDSEYHIQIETNASGYVIGVVFSQLTLGDLS